MAKIVLEIEENTYLEDIEHFNSDILRRDVSKVLQLVWAEDNLNKTRILVLTTYTAKVRALEKRKTLTNAEKKANLLTFIEELKVRFPTEFPTIGWYDLKVAISRIQDTKKVN